MQPPHVSQCGTEKIPKYKRSLTRSDKSARATRKEQGLSNEQDISTDYWTPGRRGGGWWWNRQSMGSQHSPPGQNPTVQPAPGKGRVSRKAVAPPCRHPSGSLPVTVWELCQVMHLPFSPWAPSPLLLYGKKHTKNMPRISSIKEKDEETEKLAQEEMEKGWSRGQQIFQENVTSIKQEQNAKKKEQESTLGD